MKRRQKSLDYSLRFVGGRWLKNEEAHTILMKFYPDNKSVPEQKCTDRLFLRPLKTTDVILDYEAVMASADQLHRWSQTDWPTEDFTVADNLKDLERHDREHLERKAFTYTILDPSETRCLGCVYIQPLESQIVRLYAEATYAANVGFWVRTSEIANDLDRHLLTTLREWFTAEWPIDQIVFIISQQETRQAMLLTEAGLELRSAIELSAGRPCWVYS